MVVATGPLAVSAGRVGSRLRCAEASTPGLDINSLRNLNSVIFLSSRQSLSLLASHQIESFSRDVSSAQSCLQIMPEA